MAEFIDILAQVKLDIQGDERLKGVGTALDRAVTEATQLEARIEGLKDAIKNTDSQAKKGILQNELKKANAEMVRLKGNAVGVGKEVKNLGGSFGKLGDLAAGAFASFSLLQFGQEVISATSQFQKFEAVLTNLTGDNGEAKKLLSTFSQFASETPFQVQDVIDAYIKLRNTGITPTVETIRKLGDVASASGKDLNQVIEAFTDASTFQFERLRELGLIYETNGNKVKFTFRNVATEVDKTSDAIQKYLIGLGELNGVQGANAAISQTLAGQISNLKDTFSQFAAELGQAVAPELRSVLGLIGDILNGFRTIIKLRSAAKEATEIVGGIPVSAFEREQFTFVRQFLPEINKAIDFGGKGTLARVKFLQSKINEAFADGLISQDVLFALSARLQEAAVLAENELSKTVEKTIKKAVTDPKAAEKRKEAIADITADLQKAIADQQQKLQETEIKGKEESLETIRQLSELEKQEALRAIDDRQKAIAEKLSGKIPADIKNLLAELRTGIQRQFELSLSQDIAEFTKKKEQQRIEDEAKLAAERAKQLAELAERKAEFLTNLQTLNDELISAVDIAENEALTAAQNIYNQGIISKERFEELKTKITKVQGEERIRLLINELEVERLALQNSEDKDGKLAKRITEINVAISALKLQQSQLGETTATTTDKQGELFTNIKAGYNEALSIIQQVNAAIVANETEKINTLIALQQKRVDEANRIADEGNAEALEREQNRLETLMAQREEAAQRQQRLSLILQASNFALAATEAILAFTKTTAETTVAAPVVIPLVGAALAAGIGFILSLINSTKGSIQGFAEGTPYVTGSDGVDRVPAMLSKGERVVTVKDNQRYSPIYDYLNTHQPDPKRILAAITSPYPNYGGLQRTYEANRQFEKEQLLSRALLEKMTFVNGNLEILVTETVKNRQSGKVKVTNVNEIAKAVNNDNLRWKI